MGRLVEYEDASAEVREIYEEIMQVRGFRVIPAFYRALAVDPATLRSFWNRFREVMSRKRIAPLEKELIGIAVCVALGGQYAIEAHIDIARKLGMDDEMFGELVAVIGAFSETSAICKSFSLNYDGDPQT
jgi:AhpD family alkylhydroperoxidase